MMKEFKVPVVVEIILERITNISMGTEINAVKEWEPVIDLEPEISLDNQEEFA